MRAKVRLAYRGDLLLSILGDLLVASVGLVFLWAVFSHVPDIRGWTLHEVLLIWGLAETSTGLFFVLFQGLWFVNQRYLLGGELDRVLLRPLDPYLQILMDNVSPGNLPVALLGAAMVGAALSGLPPLSLTQWLMLPVFVASSVALLGGLLTGVSAAGVPHPPPGDGGGPRLPGRRVRPLPPGHLPRRPPAPPDRRGPLRLRGVLPGDLAARPRPLGALGVAAAAGGLRRPRPRRHGLEARHARLPQHRLLTPGVRRPKTAVAAPPAAP